MLIPKEKRSHSSLWRGIAAVVIVSCGCLAFSVSAVMAMLVMVLGRRSGD